MADTFVQVPPDSSGKRLRMLTGLSGDLQQVVTLDSPLEVRLDYGTRTDGNPVRVGKAAMGTSTTSATWTIQSLTYDSSARLTGVHVSIGGWE